LAQTLTHYKLSIAAVVEGCPKNEAIRFDQCTKCPFFKGTEGTWPKLKVKCALRPGKPRKVVLIVPCVLKNRGISFKTCLKCSLNRGFYGFHNNEPIIYCGLPEFNKQVRQGIPLF